MDNLAQRFVCWGPGTGKPPALGLARAPADSTRLRFLDGWPASCRVAALGLVLLLAPRTAGADAAGTPEPVGPEFQVNTYTTSSQAYPSLAINAAGDFLVVWYSFGSSGSDTSERSIHAQLFDSAGAVVGNELQVNSYTTNVQWRPAVAARADEGFVVVWTSRGSSGSDSCLHSVQGQCFDSAATPAGDEFQVNTYVNGHQSYAEVAADAAGNFVVVWQSSGSFGSDSSFDSIQGQRFDSACEPVGGEFQVNTYITDQQTYPAVAVDADGDFLVVWRNFGFSGAPEKIQGQLFDSAGMQIGEELQVNADGSDGFHLSVAADAKSNFVVTWIGAAADLYGTVDVYGRRFDSSGSPIGDEFQVSTHPASINFAPNVATDGGGGFVVVWTSYGSGGSDSNGSSIQGRRYDSTGAPVSSPFQVNTYTTSYQHYPAVRTHGDGEFVVVWTSFGSSGSDSSSDSIQLQRFLSPLFADGFESGDTAAWPNAAP